MLESKKAILIRIYAGSTECDGGFWNSILEKNMADRVILFIVEPNAKLLESKVSQIFASSLLEYV